MAVMLRQNTGTAHPFRHRLSAGKQCVFAGCWQRAARCAAKTASIKLPEGDESNAPSLQWMNWPAPWCGRTFGRIPRAHRSATPRSPYRGHVQTPPRLHCTQSHHPNCRDHAAAAGLPARSALDIVLACKPKQSAIQGETA